MGVGVDGGMIPSHVLDTCALLDLAKRHGVPVFTTDRRFEHYPVKVIRQW